MILFVTVASVIVAAMIIGVPRSRAMPVASPMGADAVIEQSRNAVIEQNLASTPLSQRPYIERGQNAAIERSRNAAIERSRNADSATTPTQANKQLAAIPSVGSVQVLNGCGAEGAAKRVADFLRSKGFDVKDIGNASSLNYPSTMIISRNTDMAMANSIEKLMKTGKLILMRNGDSMYDVTVVAGPDFEEKIK